MGDYLQREGKIENGLEKQTLSTCNIALTRCLRQRVLTCGDQTGTNEFAEPNLLWGQQAEFLPNGRCLRNPILSTLDIF